MSGHTVSDWTSMSRYIAVMISTIVPLGATANAQGAGKVEVTGEILPSHIREKINALLQDELPAESRFDARRQARRAADLSLKALNSEGYFSADAKIMIEMGPPIRPSVALSPGGQFTFSNVEIDWQDLDGETKSAPPSPPALELKSGDPARAAAIIAEEKRLVQSLIRQGHADAEALPRTLIGDRETTTVDLTYNLFAGPVVCLGDLVVETEGRTRDSFVRRISTFQPGDSHNGDAVDELERRLALTRLYSIASVDVDPDTQRQGDGCVVRDVNVSLTDAPSRTLALGASFATSEGAGFQADWRRRNLTGRGDTLATRLNYAELERVLTASWTLPAFRGYGRKLTLSSSASDETTDAYDRKAVEINALYDYRWTQHLALVGGIGIEAAQETETTTKNDYHILTGQAGLRWNDVDNELDPSQGFRVNLLGEPSYVMGDLDGPFIRVTTEARGYTGFDQDRYVIAGRAKVGTVYGADRDDLPTDRRFYAGGGGSVRGYAYQGLGPVNSSGDPVGGRSLLEVSIEGRIRLSDRFGAVAFVDAGEVGTAEVPKFSTLRTGVGLGFRYFTGFGPLRVDVATPIDPEADDDPFHVYISIGQAF